MPTVTALHPERRERVRVELDGEPWRTLPAAAVVSAGLMPGVELDRPRARVLRRALRRSEALDRAASALARRDHSVAGLDAVLARRGVAASERSAALETMSRLGYLDDARVAADRAETLAARGYGDEAIRFDLARRGLGIEASNAALAALEPEARRAGRHAAKADASKAGRLLAARGFSSESIESVLGVGDS
jgi:SOS response regulatory protein OraA/RecX